MGAPLRGRCASVEGCPDHDTLFRMLQGDVRGDERASLQLHLDGCEDCHEQLLKIVMGTSRAMAAEEITRVAELSDAHATAVEGWRKRAGTAEMTLAAAVPAVQTADDLQPGTVLDGYEILELLGRGGMGAVYLAADAELGRKVAVKLIAGDAQAADKAVERFQVEARAMARFSHPNIVSVYAVGDFEGAPYVVLEYVPGKTLQERMREDKALAVPDALTIGLDVARGLAEAHRHGVIHRDLKPANVILGEDGRARILDFGLATFLTQEPALSERADERAPVSRVAVTSIVGTPRYMAPEQWLGTELSGATDVWALGAMLYEMCAGRPAFPCDDIDQLGQQVARGERPPSMRPDVDVPFALDEIVARCMHANQGIRPTASVVVTAISNILDPTASQQALPSPDAAQPAAGAAPYPKRGTMVAGLGALVLGGGVALATLGESPEGAPARSPLPSASSAVSQVKPSPMAAATVHGIAVGRTGACVTGADKSLMCWGFHTGDPEHPTSRYARQVPGLSSVVTVVRGDHHSCAVMADWSLRCWGQNDHGQLGDGSTDTRLSPVEVPGLRVKRVSAAGDHTCVLTRDKPRKVLCWGRNDHGQLGQGDRRDRLQPTEVPGLPLTSKPADAKVYRISVGARHTCVVTTTNELNCFGHNDHGQLGLDPARITEQLSPALVPLGVLRFQRVYAGTNHSCGRSQGDRNLYCWGANEHGQLGDGTTDSRFEPKLVRGVSDVQVAYPGVRHTCLYTETGDMWCFGANDHGQLSLATADDVVEPTLVRHKVKVVASKGAEHTCWITNGAHVECTGLNDFGQLGDGALKRRHTPRPVLVWPGSQAE